MISEKCVGERKDLFETVKYHSFVWILVDAPLLACSDYLPKQRDHLFCTCAQLIATTYITYINNTYTPEYSICQ